MAHLGDRVSALLDGQLSAVETERAWAHVHLCHTCRDAVEREGWVKTSLAGLSSGCGRAPDHLKGSLLGSAPRERFHAWSSYAEPAKRPFSNVGLVAMGGSAVGAAFLGVLALGVAPSDGPADRRPPATSLTRQTDPPRVGVGVPAVEQRPTR